jgi:hypothetical protein
MKHTRGVDGRPELGPVLGRPTPVRESDRSSRRTLTTSRTYGQKTEPRHCCAEAHDVFNPHCDASSFLVTTDDGVIFGCVRAPLGLGSERRWILHDSRSRQYVGPPAGSDCSPWAVQGLIANWWRSRHHDWQVIPPAMKPERRPSDQILPDESVPRPASLDGRPPARHDPAIVRPRDANWILCWT